MDNKTSMLIDEKALGNANLVDLKREKEELKQYYVALKKRRDAILSINNIKNKSQKQKLLEQNQKEEVPVALIFQEGSFRQKRDKTILLPHNQENTKVIVEDAVITTPKDFFADKPLSPPMVVKEERKVFVKRPIDAQNKLDDDINIKPITNENANLITTTPPQPPAIATNVKQFFDKNSVVNQQQPPELAKTDLNKPVENKTDTNTIQPDEAIVLEPFDMQKTDAEIKEDINTLLPKNSKSFITMISILSVIFVLILIAFIFWGFASNWNFDINNFVNDVKSFFGI